MLLPRDSSRAVYTFSTESILHHLFEMVIAGMAWLSTIFGLERHVSLNLAILVTIVSLLHDYQHKPSPQKSRRLRLFAAFIWIWATWYANIFTSISIADDNLHATARVLHYFGIILSILIISVALVSPWMSSPAYDILSKSNIVLIAMAYFLLPFYVTQNLHQSLISNLRVVLAYSHLKLTSYLEIGHRSQYQPLLAHSLLTVGWIFVVTPLFASFSVVILINEVAALRSATATIITPTESSIESAPDPPPLPADRTPAETPIDDVIESAIIDQKPSSNADVLRFYQAIKNTETRQRTSTASSINY